MEGGIQLKVLSFFDNSITAVDLGSYETKIIVGKQEREGISVKKAFSFITPPNTYDNGYIEDEFKLAAAVREELAKNNISGGACHITVKSTAILTREILLPRLSGKDIAGLLHYQMEEHLPMDFSKYVIQHKAVERITEGGKEKLNVLVAAVPKELVEMHYDFVRKLGLKPEVMDYQSNSIWKFLNHAGSVNGSLYPQDKTIAAIDLGYSNSNVTIVSEGKAKLNRVIDSGGHSLDKNISSLTGLSSEEIKACKQGIIDVSTVEEGYSEQNRYTNIVKTSIEGIMDKIDKVFRYYVSKEPEKRVEVLLLYGGLSRIRGIENLFSGYFNIPASVLVSTSRIYPDGDINAYANCAGALIMDNGV